MKKQPVPGEKWTPNGPMKKPEIPASPLPQKPEKMLAASAPETDEDRAEAVRKIKEGMLNATPIIAEALTSQEQRRTTYDAGSGIPESSDLRTKKKRSPLNMLAQVATIVLGGIGFTMAGAGVIFGWGGPLLHLALLNGAPVTLATLLPFGALPLAAIVVGASILLGARWLLKKLRGETKGGISKPFVGGYSDTRSDVL